jgi:type IV pilus assembly protein PilM
MDDAGIELDFIQLSPVSVFNTTVHSLMGELPPISEYDPDNPPKSVVVLSMGTDTTDLVVTNGYRVWQRSIPLGGNHFTKQLTKELKLTFGKAEHLKRNSREADDPKKVFQAMRPVFNDLVTEVQRSIGYFQSLDRNAKISHIVGMGNAFKLPGLEPYLEKNLGHTVKVLSTYPKMSGPAMEGPKFKKNAQSMGVCYG